MSGLAIVGITFLTLVSLSAIEEVYPQNLKRAESRLTSDELINSKQ